jgi:thiazole/oxazole-forming peptide maturase SagD family component
VAKQIAFHPWLSGVAPDFCEEFERAIRSAPLFFSISVGHAPFGTGELAMLLDPPVLPVCLAESEALCGPLYFPGRTVCPECLEHWFDNNFYDRGEPRCVADAGVARGLAEGIGQWCRALADGGRVTELEGGAISLSYDNWRAGWHAVVARRDCERCREFAARLHTAPQAHCSRWTGIVSRVEASTNPSAGAFRAIGTWQAPAPVAEARPYLARQNSFGRGRSRQDAELGCIGEAIERYSLIYRGDEPMIRARLRDVDGIHPDEIQLFSEAQYRSRDEWNACADEIFEIFARFDGERPVDWVEARGLGRESGTRYVPAACCLMWYEFRHGEDQFARADTIGCGTGASFADALIHALLEWIERDAMAIWWENRLRRPAVRLESFECEGVRAAAQGLRAIGRDLFLLDCTTDIGIPAYVSVAPRFDGSEPLFAGAAHWSAKTAAYKAATEPGQMWYAAKVSGSADKTMWQWLSRETVETQPYLAPYGWVDAPPDAEMAKPESLEYILGRLESAGLRAYAVDHSRSDVICPTVRAVVPGMRHIWNRRGPGRLYDVPVRMGWRNEASAENSLNPIRCMI